MTDSWDEAITKGGCFFFGEFPEAHMISCVQDANEVHAAGLAEHVETHIQIDQLGNTCCVGLADFDLCVHNGRRAILMHPARCSTPKTSAMEPSATRGKTRRQLLQPRQKKRASEGKRKQRRHQHAETCTWIGDLWRPVLRVLVIFLIICGATGSVDSSVPCDRKVKGSVAVGESFCQCPEFSVLDEAAGNGEKCRMFSSWAPGHLDEYGCLCRNGPCVKVNLCTQTDVTAVDKSCKKIFDLAIGYGCPGSETDAISSLAPLSFVQEITKMGIREVSGLRSFHGLSQVIKLDELRISNVRTKLSLEGFDSLTKMGDLRLVDSDGVESFEGLSKITELGDLSIIQRAKALTFSGFQSLRIITGQLRLEDASGPVSFAGLGHVKEIGSLELERDSQVSLAGFNSLEAINGRLRFSNTNMTPDASGPVNGVWKSSHQAFESHLHLIDGDLWISNCLGLTSLQGFEHVWYIKGNIWISGNKELTSLEGLNRTVVYGSVRNGNVRQGKTIADNHENLKPCKPGTSGTLGVVPCKECPPGTANHMYGIDALGCRRCKSGTFSGQGHTSCVRCPTMYVASGNAKKCELWLLSVNGFRNLLFTYVSSACVGIAGVAYIYLMILQRRAKKLLSSARRNNDLHDCRLAFQMAARSLCGRHDLEVFRDTLTLLENRYVDDDSIFIALQDEGTKLVRGTWMQHWCERFVRRQDLPKEAFYEHEELHVFVHLVRIVAISYCWLNPVNPDPNGDHLKVLKKAIQLRLKVKGDSQLQDIVLFLDYMSLPQHGETGDPTNPERGHNRSPMMEEIFRAGLKNVNLWYAHQRVEVWLLRWTPSIANMFAYEDRGWPFFEQSVASLITHAAKLLDLTPSGTAEATTWEDLSHKCRAKRRPPIVPAKFAKELESKRFTNGRQDANFVQEKYEETFTHVISYACCLWFVDLAWDDSAMEELAEVLPFCDHLEQLVLNNNCVTPEGAKIIVEAAAGAETLRGIDLCGNLIPREAWPKLTKIWVNADKNPDGLLLEQGTHASEVFCHIARNHERDLEDEPPVKKMTGIHGELSQYKHGPAFGSKWARVRAHVVPTKWQQLLARFRMFRFGEDEENQGSVVLELPMMNSRLHRDHVSTYAPNLDMMEALTTERTVQQRDLTKPKEKETKKWAARSSSTDSFNQSGRPIETSPNGDDSWW